MVETMDGDHRHYDGMSTFLPAFLGLSCVTTVYCHILKRKTWEFAHGETGGLYPFYLQNPLKYSRPSKPGIRRMNPCQSYAAIKVQRLLRVHLAPDNGHDGTSKAQ